MSGPLSTCIENPMKNRAFFPTHPRLKPIGCAKKPRDDPEDATPANQQHAQTKEDINLQFMNKGNKIFRSFPNLSSEYSDWLNKMEKAQTPVWKEMGIYDLVILSKTRLSYCPLMLVFVIFPGQRPFHISPSLWNGDSNSLRHSSNYRPLTN